jgi:hypothetical protein
MGLFMFSIWGLRVSRLLDHRAVSGSKSDTPTRAKILGSILLKWATQSREFAGIMEYWNVGIMENGERSQLR